MNTIKEIQGINDTELRNGSVGTSASWHAKYAESAWVYAGNLPIRLTEGDVLCVLSQWGEIEDINLVRDEDTGKSKGFAFVKYEDARSCVLAVDNFCGVQVLGRSIRVDHVEKYRLPKHLLEKEEGSGEGDDDGAGKDVGAGHAYRGEELASAFDISKGQDLFNGPPPPPEAETTTTSSSKDIGGKDDVPEAKRKRKEARDLKRREKEERRSKKEEKRRRKRAKVMSSSSRSRRVHEDYNGRREHHTRRRSASRSPSRSRSHEGVCNREGNRSSR